MEDESQQLGQPRLAICISVDFFATSITCCLFYKDIIRHICNEVSDAGTQLAWRGSACVCTLLHTFFFGGGHPHTHLLILV